MKANPNALGPEALDSKFSKNVRSDWESFMTFNQIQKPSVRDVILSSWQRSRNAQVMPTENDPRVLASVSDLEILREKHANLLRAADIAVKSLGEMLETSQSMLLVADPQCMLLETYGHRATLEVGKKQRSTVPGACWSEGISGTNAIGTAVAIGSPVQIHSSEHYREGIRVWTCSAALVRGVTNTDIVGVVDLSGFAKTFNTHNLALAMSIAGQIEATLAGWRAHDQIALLQWCNKKSLAWRNDGLVILDDRGCVISTNENAHEILEERGINVKLAHGARLFDVKRMKHIESSTTYINWILEDWIKPVVIGGKLLGALVVIPRKSNYSHAVVEKRPQDFSLEHDGDSTLDQAFSRIVSSSEVMCSAINRAKKLSAVNCPVLIQGETGVGKEEFALAIHKGSTVSGGPFVAVNCGALVKELVASELFGYSEGAFTGARRGGRAGKFEEANGGSLFLDEIGELPLDVQTHLLRVLQDGTVIRMGDNVERKVSVRILSATHRNLREAICNGQFREDLYYRIAITSLVIPPLRARTNDIEPLTEHFLNLLFQQYGGRRKIHSPELLETLTTYAWPGNVRELKNVIESMWHLAEGDMLRPEDIEYEQLVKIRTVVNTDTHLSTAEREAIVAAINRTGGNMLKTAQQLGIARSTLYKKMKLYGLSK